MPTLAASATSISRQPGILRLTGRNCGVRLAAGCILLAFGSVALPPKAQASDRHTPIVKAVQGAKDSIVNIHGQKMLGATDEPAARGEIPRKVNGMGTGVVIDERGYIITNFHVVEGVQKIEVTLADGAEYIAKLIASDSSADLAVIKINAQSKLPVVPIGTSSDLMVGESVIAVGNAYGYENTVTDGIVSALHRSVQVSDAQGYEDLIQVSAAINPGNSGGPLLNIDGEMIGINVAVRAGAQGIGFAIPVDKAMSVATKLLSVERLGWHGIVVQETGNGQPGLVVSAVEKESPAEKTGIRPGDVITTVAKQELIRPLDLERTLLARKPGEEVPLVVRRNDQSVKLLLTLGTLPAHASADSDLPWDMLGLKLTQVPAEQFKQYHSNYRGGLTVVDVRPDSPAARQGLHRGDVLVGMHVWATVSVENVNYILNRSDLADIEPMKFYIFRNSTLYEGRVTVAMQKKATRE
ncbi:MAG TPA: trypsin-like peptidase domain-containing protein [Pirellulales bacterium]|jgi:serine protease Do|nr:trypsin-like peptidase domain-containing protein [Pirellulales bacterium]